MPTALTKEIIEKAKKDLSYPSQLFINGKYDDSITGKTFDNISPINGKLINKVVFSQKEDIDKAVEIARKTFESGVWSRATPSHRKKVILKFAELLKKNSLELAVLDTLDMGKTINDTYTSDVPGSIKNVRWYGELIDKVYDDIAPTPYNSLALITKEPIGVVVAIVPWNYPLMMAAWKVGPALVTGNSLILKPAEQSPLTAIRMAELLAEAGLPEGVFNVLPGDGTTGKTLALHNDVDCVAFTGSGEVGKKILEYSGQSNMKKVQLECGGKSPNVIFADCENLDTIVKVSATAIFGNQGEVCSAGSRLIVEEKIKDEFVEKMVNESKNMMPGDPWNPRSFMGAIVDKTQLEKIDGYVQQGKKEGAKVVTGGKIMLKNTGGYYYEPTVFDNVKNNMKIAQEEIFGPVLSSITFKSADEALKIANDTNYGLAAAVWTKDINKAHLMAKGLKAGTVFVNNYDESDLTVPAGGFKQSGIGRDNSYHALDTYLQIKSTWIKLEDK